MLDLYELDEHRNAELEKRLDHEFEELHELMAHTTHSQCRYCHLPSSDGFCGFDEAIAYCREIEEFVDPTHTALEDDCEWVEA